MVEPLPDLNLKLVSTRIGNVATYMCFGFCGLCLGSRAGRVVGFRSALGIIAEEAGRLERLETSYRRMMADVLVKSGGMVNSWGVEGSVLAQELIKSNAAF